MILDSLHHDPHSFCEGLVKHKNFLYESSGAYKRRSYIIKYDLDTMDIVQKYVFDNDDFSEGITVFDGEVVCLTWKSKRLYYFDLDLNPIQVVDFNYKECWGLTHNNKSLILTDGSTKIQFIHPNTHRLQRTIRAECDNLNAVAYHKNHIYANVWHTGTILKICEHTGATVREWDFSKVFKERFRQNTSVGQSVMNGIVHTGKGHLFLITGKNWNRMYLVDLV